LHTTPVIFCSSKLMGQNQSRGLFTVLISSRGAHCPPASVVSAATTPSESITPTSPDSRTCSHSRVEPGERQTRWRVANRSPRTSTTMSSRSWSPWADGEEGRWYTHASRFSQACMQTQGPGIL
jgi:hypothetical protein